MHRQLTDQQLKRDTSETHLKAESVFFRFTSIMLSFHSRARTAPCSTFVVLHVGGVCVLCIEVFRRHSVTLDTFIRALTRELGRRPDSNALNGRAHLRNTYGTLGINIIHWNQHQALSDHFQILKILNVGWNLYWYGIPLPIRHFNQDLWTDFHLVKQYLNAVMPFTLELCQVANAW